MRIVQLAHETDFQGWREAARRLLAVHAPPASLDWQAGPLVTTLFPDELPSLPEEFPARTATVPAKFIELCESVILHNDPGRFGLLYKLLWRLQLEPGLLQLSFDADIRKAEMMVKAVRRDMHKMKAFLRFRELKDAAGASRFIAWFEPEHHIVAALASFFTGRFTNMDWSILTPQTSMHWHQGQLYFTEGARREDAPGEDAGESLWLTYYQHIFNPARLKIKAMQKEMPKKYWRNLPEAALIASLIADADKRTTAMIEAEPAVPSRKIRPYLPVSRKTQN